MIQWLIHKYACSYILHYLVVCNYSYVLYGALAIVIFAIIWIATVVSFAIATLIGLSKL